MRMNMTKDTKKKPKRTSTREFMQMRIIQSQIDFVENHPQGRFCLWTATTRRDPNVMYYGMHCLFSLKGSIFIGLSNETITGQGNLVAGNEFHPAEHHPYSVWGKSKFYDSFDALVRAAYRDKIPTELIMKFDKLYHDSVDDCMKRRDRVVGELRLDLANRKANIVI